MWPFKQFNSLNDNDEIPFWMNASVYYRPQYRTKAEMFRRKNNRLKLILHALFVGVKVWGSLFVGLTGIGYGITTLAGNETSSESPALLMTLMGLLFLAFAYVITPHYLYIVRSVFRPLPLSTIKRR